MSSNAFWLQIDNNIQQRVNSSWIRISRKSLWSMVSILDLLQCFSFQFIKNNSAAMWIDRVGYRMEGSHYVNWNSIIYRKKAIHRTEIQRPFLAAKGFNTNLVQFLLLHVILSNVHNFSPLMHGCVLKTVLSAQNLVYKIL